MVISYIIWCFFILICHWCFVGGFTDPLNRQILNSTVLCLILYCYSLGLLFVKFSPKWFVIALKSRCKRASVTFMLFICGSPRPYIINRFVVYSPYVRRKCIHTPIFCKVLLCKFTSTTKLNKLISLVTKG